jgi:hypothetical protein
MLIQTFRPTALLQRPAHQPEPVTETASAAPAPVVDRVEVSSNSTSPVEDRFREVFFRDYEESKCGQNIRRFIVQFPQPEHLEGAKVLGIENKGFSYFGLARVMHARDTNFKGEMRTTDKNWYHHVVLEKDGRIYDFDYGITPQAPTVEEYFEKMFLSCDKVRPHEKLKDYQVQVIDAQEYARADKDTSTTRRLGEYLQGWGVNLERYQVSSS